MIRKLLSFFFSLLLLLLFSAHPYSLGATYRELRTLVESTLFLYKYDLQSLSFIHPSHLMIHDRGVLALDN